MNLIGPGVYKYENRPLFVTYPLGGKFHVWGPIDMLPEDTAVAVYSYSARKNEAVHILKHVAYRDVRRHNQQLIRFVMCTFDKTVNEGPFEGSDT